MKSNLNEIQLIQIYRKILDEIDNGIHVIDGEGNTIIYNKKMMEIEGMNMEDVLDKNILDVFSFNKKDESTLIQALQKGKATENVKQSYFNNKGQEITAINKTIPITDGPLRIGAMEIARDVTRLEKIIRENILHKGNTRYTFDSIIGKSPEIQEVIEASKRATRTSSSVLITGETGTGKELFAQSIHNGSSRSGAPFISQNCAALPDSLIEGILFGTKKGAFTGSIDRPGLFEQAQGGTLLLDEINALNPSLQAKLLRVIQEKTVRRIGDTKDLAIDVRIMATINEDPIDAIASERLRKDLYYRLSVVSLFIPPLRDRLEDLPALGEFFIKKYSQLFGMNVKSIDADVTERFLSYDWPGNVRELEHLIEGSMNLVEYESAISFAHLPISFRKKSQFKHYVTETTDVPNSSQSGKSLEEYMADAEKYYIIKVLKQNDYNITKTAESLGMSRQNLQYRLKKWQIHRP
ncbi:sigma-54-dependent Fis family transcriptional regulator [Bacillus sp. M6-12]|uniref:sigma-54 interaction domain-containing protein n=1 Tax=Bacillus sp. M6-12 TaxID=2054166 RepID=UPI000C7708DD|nr:sigma 54-interacting transcriptional regulator [Bacillus sp. M6-12]PLS15705.1 sigma-54-dependent Fis family transcriptional regulator [Bacillus sp. M6-12]